jgi:hypothetical protein
MLCGSNDQVYLETNPHFSGIIPLAHCLILLIGIRLPRALFSRIWPVLQLFPVFAAVRSLKLFEKEKVER